MNLFLQIQCMEYWVKMSTAVFALIVCQVIFLFHPLSSSCSVLSLFFLEKWLHAVIVIVMWPGPTCLCSWDTCASRVPMGRRHLRTVFRARGCPDSTCSPGSGSCHWSGKRSIQTPPNIWCTIPIWAYMLCYKIK